MYYNVYQQIMKNPDVHACTQEYQGPFKFNHPHWSVINFLIFHRCILLQKESFAASKMFAYSTSH